MVGEVIEKRFLFIVSFSFYFRLTVPIPLYLDQDHLLYKSFGLGRRCTLLGVHMIDRYAQKILNNVKIPPKYSGDDVFLMGGDYIVSEDYKVVYEFATQENERPAVDELLSELHKLQQ